MRRTGHVGNVTLRDLGAILDEPLHALLEAGELLERRRLERKGRVERDKPDERADRELLDRAGAPGDGVKVEALLVVPERDLAVAIVVGHRVRDEQEVLEKLFGQIGRAHV